MSSPRNAHDRIELLNKAYAKRTAAVERYRSEMAKLKGARKEFAAELAEANSEWNKLLFEAANERDMETRTVLKVRAENAKQRIDSIRASDETQLEAQQVARETYKAELAVIDAEIEALGGKLVFSPPQEASR